MRLEDLRTHAQTAETAMDLLQALEAVQLTAVRRGDWLIRLEPHEMVVLRDTWVRLAELRRWLVEQQEERECLEPFG
jgi:hypothetical protein